MLGKVCEEKWLFSPKGKGNPNISGELFQPYMWTLGAGAELSTILTRSEKNIFYIIFFPKRMGKSYLTHYTFWLGPHLLRFYRDMELEMGILIGEFE